MSSSALLEAGTAVLASSASKPKEIQAKDAIVDIRRGNLVHSMRNDILEKLQPGDGKEKKLPTLILYDEMGLKLFEAISFLDEVFIQWRAQLLQTLMLIFT